mgnify:CR=1 FL=1
MPEQGRNFRFLRVFSFGFLSHAQGATRILHRKNQCRMHVALFHESTLVDRFGIDFRFENQSQRQRNRSKFAFEKIEITSRDGYIALYLALLGRQFGPRAATIIGEMEREDFVSLAREYSR